MSEERPRVLTLWMDTYYMSGKGVSSERMFWGDGLFGRLGYDEHHIKLEHAGHGELDKIIRAYAPYEFVFMQPYQEIPYWLRTMVGSDTPIVTVHADAVWRWDSFDRHFVNISDFMWLTDAGAAQRLHDLKYEGAILSSWAARPEWALPDPIEVPQRGASFAGWLYGDRLSSLQAIGEAGDVTVIAHNCRDRLLTPEEYHRFTASWAFALCLTKSSHGAPQMKARMFEPQIHGAVLVTEPMDGLSSYWTPDEECLIFTSPAEAQDKMRYLLDDPKRYLAMSQLAYNRLLAEHTWYHRMRDVIVRLGKTPPAWPSSLLQEPGAAVPAARPALTIPISAIDEAP